MTSLRMDAFGGGASSVVRGARARDVVPFFDSLRRRFPSLDQVFASGANRVGDLLGFVGVGIAPGVAVPELNEAAVALLERLATSAVPMFLDSGAFSEVAFGPQGPRVVRPIGDAEWEARLAVMHRIARAGAGSVTVVAPDQVGSQQETLGRLRRYRDAVAALVGTGARVLIPLQRGTRAPVPFYKEACDIVGCPLVPALPMKKASTPASEAVAILEALQAPSAHLLGLGIKGAQTPDILRSACHLAPNTRLTLDANLITANVGRASGLRPLTVALDAERDAMAESAWSTLTLPVANVVLDYTDEIGQPSAWMSGRVRRGVAAAAGLSPSRAAAFVRDPDAFDCGADPALEFAMDVAWRQYVDGAASSDRQARATALAFAAHAVARQFSTPAWVGAYLPPVSPTAIDHGMLVSA